MKSLYITNLGILDNLSQTQVLPYLEGLSRKGIEIHILSFEKKERLRDASAAGNMRKRLKDSNIRWDCLRYHNRWGNILDLFAGIFKTFGIVKSREIAVLHARASIPALIAWPVAKLLRRRIIYDRRGTMVGDFADDVNVTNVFSISIFSSALGAIERFIIRHSDAIVVLSERARSMLRQEQCAGMPEKLIENIPCCVDMPKFSKSKEKYSDNFDGRFVMSYLGSLGSCYLLGEMAAFFKALKEEKENALFLIVSHTGREFIDNILEKENLIPESDYTIKDVIPDEVPDYISGSNASIMFIKPIECKIGCSPTKLGESLAAGVPVIVNKSIGDTEALVKTNRVGVIVDGFDNKSYKKAIAELLGLIKEGDTLNERCRRTAGEHLDIGLGIDRYKSVYERIR